MVVRSLWKDNFRELEPYWDAVLGLAAGATVMPLVGPGDDGKPNATTFKSRRGDSTGIVATFTWSGAPSAFATPLDLTDQDSWIGAVPKLTFDGSNNECDTPDAAYWSRNDASSEAFSLVWVAKLSTLNAKNIWNKYGSAGTREWFVSYGSGSRLEITMRDDSAGQSQSSKIDVALGLGVWTHIVMTYDGSGGGTGANGITWYVDGVVRASTATNNGSYVAMEDLAEPLSLFQFNDGTNKFTGEVAGGPFGPTMYLVALTAAQVERHYNLWRGAAGLG
jgi:hypothetical protein